MPNDTPLLLLKVIADRLFDVVPPLTLMALISPAVEGTVYEAVMTDEFDIPNEMPFELLKIAVPLVAVCVPADGTTTFCVCADCALTENWNCWPVVDRIVMAPRAENVTLPLV
jgi:hypothetical protein